MKTHSLNPMTLKKRSSNPIQVDGEVSRLPLQYPLRHHSP
jgi:hypothetical protein